MQQLGISPNAPKSQSRLKELFWPEISDEVAAETAARNGTYAGLFIAGVSALFAAIGVIERGALIDAVIFVLIGFGIKRMSRTAAIIGLVLYLSEQFYALVHGRGGWNVIVMAIIAALYVGAIRAAFWHHQAIACKPTTTA